MTQAADRDRKWIATLGLGDEPRKLFLEAVCRTGQCRNDATHMTVYKYVTGRAGSTSFARRWVCTDHAHKFAAKHGIEISPAHPAPVHALETAVRALQPS
jgi:hypothetical protein